MEIPQEEFDETENIALNNFVVAKVAIDKIIKEFSVFEKITKDKLPELSHDAIRANFADIFIQHNIKILGEEYLYKVSSTLTLAVLIMQEELDKIRATTKD